jgi:hypothetical protein
MHRLPLLQLLGRHKLAVAISVLLTVGAMAALFLSAPTTYGAKASLVLFNPPTPPDPSQSASQDPAVQNPYARFDDLSVVVDILRRRVTSEPVTAQLTSRGLVGTYAVAANISYYHGPIIDVTASAPTAQAATNSAGLVIGELQNELKSLQVEQGTDPKYQIKSQTVVAPLAEVTSASARLRKTLLAGALGVTITVALALIADVRNKARDAAVRADGSKGISGSRRLHRPHAGSHEQTHRPASPGLRPDRTLSAPNDLSTGSPRERLARAGTGSQDP